MAQAIELRTVRQARHDPEGLWLFTVVRNEAYFLGHFFEHYRRLGVRNFLVYDDGSSDGTGDILATQESCSVITSGHAFDDNFGIDVSGKPRRLFTALRESVPEHYFRGQWVVSVDADEFIVLPPEMDSLPQLIGVLESRGQPFATAPMVDFYPETLDGRNYPEDLSPFAGNPYFDRGPLFDWSTGRIFPIQFQRGVRYRLLRRLADTAPDLVAKIYGAHPVSLAKSWKVPLLRHGSGVRRIGDHEISVPPTPGPAVALAHFKFYPGLDDKVADAVKRGQYYNASMEYRFLQAAVARLGGESLLGPESVRYSGPSSLTLARLLPPTA